MAEKSKHQAKKEQGLAAIAAATTEAELDALWKDLERAGWRSKVGIMYATLLRRKQELGVKLSDGDVAQLALREQQRQKRAGQPEESNDG